MPHALPIACSLAGGELETRLAAMADLGADALVGRRLHGRHAELRFAAATGVRDRVRAVAAAEARCCAFLRLRVADEPGAVVLTVDAPPDAELVLAELVDAFGTPVGGDRP